MNNQPNEAAKLLGAKGGMAGKGKAKTRSKAHYKRLVAIRRANAAARKAAKAKTSGKKSS